MNSLCSETDNSSVATRPIVFIDSSDSKQKITHSDTGLMFRPPFPPVLEADDIFGKRPDGTNPTKPPNAFILYRRAFVKSASANGYKFPMTVISSMASQAWEQELPFIKEEYKKIANEAKKKHELLFPKAPKINESKRWRVYPIKPRNKSTPEQSTPLVANTASQIISVPSTLSTSQVVNENNMTAHEWEQLFNFYIDSNQEKNDEQNVFVWEDFLENEDQVEHRSSIDLFQLDQLPEFSVEAQLNTFLEVENNTENLRLIQEMNLTHFPINESLDSCCSSIDFCLLKEYEPLDFIIPQGKDNVYHPDFYATLFD